MADLVFLNEGGHVLSAEGVSIEVPKVPRIEAPRGREWGGVSSFPPGVVPGNGATFHLEIDCFGAFWAVF